MFKKSGYITIYFLFSVICYSQQSAPATLEQANDFAYTLASGEEKTMYSLRSEAVLLCFYNPSCEDCLTLMDRLNNSPVITKLLAAKRLSVLAIYPEDDQEMWLENKSHVPSAWINGYDPETAIILDDLYDLTQTPTLYLLDNRKRFLLKDATADEVERTLKQLFDIQ